MQHGQGVGTRTKILCQKRLLLFFPVCYCSEYEPRQYPPMLPIRFGLHLFAIWWTCAASVSCPFPNIAFSRPPFYTRNKKNPSFQECSLSCFASVAMPSRTTPSFME